MKIIKHKWLASFVALGFVVSAFAQKQDKKFKETFNVKKDVVVQINATNTDIDVTTWNKNQVEVSAVIEIEGLTKKEAEKYFEKYTFGALGNSSLVKITSKGSGFYGFNDNIVIFGKDDFHFPEIVIPDMNFDFQFPDIETMVIPEVNLEKVFEGLENLEFDFDKYHKDGDTYFFQWKDSAKSISIKSKKEWEKFKKSKEYKKWKKEMKANNEKLKSELAKMKIELKGVNKEVIKKALKEAKIAISKVDMKDIKEELAKARKQMNNVKKEYFFNTNSNDVMINDKKVKIKKKITIKVPKGATFDLNTRHCKVKLPQTTASGKVSYGKFIAEGLTGGDLKVYYAPVDITTLQSANLSLHNVTDASIASVTNTTLFSSSGELKINTIFSNVNLESSFGELSIEKFDASIADFKLVLNQSDATINLTGLKKHLNFESDDVTVSTLGTKEKSKDGIKMTGKFSVISNNKKFKILGKYSELDVKI
jgi:hypothetical protein